MSLYPDRYDHIWEGDYVRAFEGAYFAQMLSEARAQGRIGKVSADPLLPLRAFIDIGGSGATADAFTIWIVQWVGTEIRVLDYYESVGQVLAFHVNWLRSRGYAQAILHLPHDGINENNITGKRYEDHLREAGFTVEPPVKNQGRGAAMMRIEALRRLGPQIWWNETTTEAGPRRHRLLSRAQGRRPQCRPWAGARLVEPRGGRAGADGDLLRGAGEGGNFNRTIDYADRGWR